MTALEPNLYWAASKPDEWQFDNSGKLISNNAECFVYQSCSDEAAVKYANQEFCNGVQLVGKLTPECVERCPSLERAYAIFKLMKSK